MNNLAKHLDEFARLKVANLSDILKKNLLPYKTAIAIFFRTGN